MRYLLFHHPGLVALVLFAAVMLCIRYGVAPYIVHTYGALGVVVTLAVLFVIGFWIEGRSKGA